MDILAIYNIKGGVGKTSSAVNLAYEAAQDGARVLLWDLDPQGAASFYFRVKPRVKGGTKKLLSGKRDLADSIKGTNYYNLDLMPADFSYRNLDILLDDLKKPTRKIRQLLKPLEGDYDYVFLDCPPGITLLSESIMIAADALIIPLIPTTLSLRTFEQIEGFCKTHDIRKMAIMPFFSMVDRRKTMHKEILENLPRTHSEVLSSFIPYASLVERMGYEREPVSAYAPESVAGLAFYDLWQEIKARLSPDKA